MHHRAIEPGAAHLQAIEPRLHRRLDALSAEILGRLDALERDLRCRVDDLASELRDRLEAMDAELGARVDALNAGREGSEDLDRVLATVPGVGPVRRQALIAAFGDLDRLRRASREELETHGGIPAALAARIQEQLAAESARPSDRGTRPTERGTPDGPAS